MSASVRRRCAVEGDSRSIQQPDDHRSHRRSSAISLVCHVSPPVMSVPGSQPPAGAPICSLSLFCSRPPPSPSLFFLPLLLLQPQSTCRRESKSDILCEFVFIGYWGSERLAYRRVRRSVIFLLHVALDVPIAIQGLWSPLGLPFLELNNTTIVFIKVQQTALSAFGFSCEVCPVALCGTRRGGLRGGPALLQSPRCVRLLSYLTRDVYAVFPR